VVVSDSPVPVKKKDTACKSNITILTKKITMNCPKEKCVSADLMHLFLVRFVTVRLTYIFIDYPDCEYIIILNTSIFSFGQFIHEEYVSMDATSLRKLLQRGATV
jgi:hypothetical protein